MEIMNHEKQMMNETPIEPVRETTTQKKIRTTIYLPVELHKSSKIYCAKNGISLTQLVINYLNNTVNTGNS
jgi:predicted HicB family RNase H-like nuclease